VSIKKPIELQRHFIRYYISNRLIFLVKTYVDPSARRVSGAKGDGVGSSHAQRLRRAVIARGARTGKPFNFRQVSL
jgi:hypothetical protein